ncbi:quinoprotein dehydrogenase-associated SoxYZ-like carrier [Rhodovulum sulfidophilum]|uniref:Quinoprotein dehydrogenase-associated SoxYZ-like carrier n=1 Tax=Rhodovulum visakhapatnamense TaxID=364297 RepID=A0ABS1RE38_9RHOB|nr:quinoprotein dehydrogenase-associated SoxYZ-like carrier [Rhodovulum visakhapatnamense]MBL3569641.1 quinoprotein dehydrogenase-associated SoxYZ-like carrier [Rhodovulum visakhapatnamense]MBL3577873.1 quinoprotein dehydrogenase-associated SoxYZ-like carrier [Rhodovulum visakhapatnamense]OLS43679.1 quinoprotein dehydrogenase-associated SoxYZ-like carrier [Rhodovulum sulfidophilum]
MRPVLLCLLLAATPVPARSAEIAWDGIAPMLLEGRTPLPAGEAIRIASPYRTENDARTVIGVEAEGPGGRLIQRVTVVLDENPMPVSAVLELARPHPRLAFDITFRINGPTPLHVLAETADGEAYLAEGFVKTSGQGACAAPPGTAPEAALARLGEMRLEMTPLGAAGRLAALAHGGPEARLGIGIRHPSLSGQQRDQVTLLFIPMRYVERLEVDLDGQPFAALTGSISLSENPEIGLDVPAGTRRAEATMTDTDGTVAHAGKDFPGY